MKLYTDSYDATLDKLFKKIIEAGILAYRYVRKSNPSLTAGNFLKKDENYFEILKDHLGSFRDEIPKIFSDAKI